MGCGLGQGAMRNGFPHCSLKNDVSPGESGKRWVSKFFWQLDSKGQTCEETWPLKRKEELMIVVPEQLSLIINCNNYCTTPVFSSLVVASLP